MSFSFGFEVDDETGNVVSFWYYIQWFIFIILIYIQYLIYSRRKINITKMKLIAI